MRVLPDVVEAELLAQYAKSGRSKCKICQGNIGNAALRLGIMSEMLDSGHRMRHARWFHVTCFFEKTGAWRGADVNEFAGAQGLSASDRRNLARELAEAEAKACAEEEKAAEAARPAGLPPLADMLAARVWNKEWGYGAEFIQWLGVQEQGGAVDLAASDDEEGGAAGGGGRAGSVHAGPEALVVEDSSLGAGESESAPNTEDEAATVADAAPGAAVDLVASDEVDDEDEDWC
eukprot:g7451.t1